MKMKSPLSYFPVASGLLVLVLSLAVGVLTVTSKQGTQNTATKAAERMASLSLVPDTGDYTYSSNQSYPVGIIVDSVGKSVDGVDVIIKFDPQKATVLGTTVTVSNMFENFPMNKIDNVKGEIRLGGLTFEAKAQVGIVGSFQFKPKGPGKVNFQFDFTPGVTTDSNIAEHGTAKDLLGKVINGSYTFK